MVQQVPSALKLILADTVWGVESKPCREKKRSEAATMMPPEPPAAGRDTYCVARLGPSVSLRRVSFQTEISVSCRQTINAPEEVIRLRTLARFAAAFRPLMFQQSTLQSDDVI